ncbi:unnamed protein product [Protopolystoma xenopodis]|uniref:Uncharacterized protein n=1 Tax=Protopolystoma xenopodis TaxID=117903 RepID=A0A448WZM8_9PLAT|nr:unnamed protein product [Protopolystoma xenopodis]
MRLVVGALSLVIAHVSLGRLGVMILTTIETFALAGFVEALFMRAGVLGRVRQPRGRRIRRGRLTSRLRVGGKEEEASGRRVRRRGEVNASRGLECRSRGRKGVTTVRRHISRPRDGVEIRTALKPKRGLSARPSSAGLEPALGQCSS